MKSFMSELFPETSSRRSEPHLCQEPALFQIEFQQSSQAARAWIWCDSLHCTMCGVE
jgi:hypothetical protein